MNDEFLYALRRQPSDDFARKLKLKLVQQGSRRTARFSVRTLLTLTLIGSSALTWAFLAMNSRSTDDGENQGSHQLASAGHPPSTPNAPQTSASPLRMTAGGGTLNAGEESPESRRFPDANPRSPTKPGSTSSSTSPVQTGATLAGGSTGFVTGSSNERAMPRVGVVTSSLADPLTRKAIDGLPRDWKAAIEVRTEEAAAAFAVLCSKFPAQPGDIVIASRPITDAELAGCRQNGVRDVSEFKLGYQAVVLAGGTTSAPIKLSTASIQLALAQQIWDPSGVQKLINNPYHSWDNIDATLDSRGIEVLGPARDTTLRRVFELLVLGPGCDTHAEMRQLQVTDPERYADICYSIRADRLYREVEQTPTMVSQNLWAEPHAIAVVDYNFYREQHADLSGSVLAGIEPTDVTLADGSYPLARPVYVYANSNMVRADRGAMAARIFWQFVNTSAPPWGYLLRAGLTPISDDERKAQIERLFIPSRSSSVATKP